MERKEKTGRMEGWRDERTERREGGLLCHCVSVYLLNGMSQWKEKQ